MSKRKTKDALGTLTIRMSRDSIEWGCDLDGPDSTESERRKRRRKGTLPRTGTFHVWAGRKTLASFTIPRNSSVDSETIFEAIDHRYNS